MVGDEHSVFGDGLGGVVDVDPGLGVVGGLLQVGVAHGPPEPQAAQSLAPEVVGFAEVDDFVEFLAEV